MSIPTSEGVIVRSIHRHCQFHLRVIQEAGSAPLPLSYDVVGLIGQDVSGGSTFSRWSRPRRLCLRRRRRGVGAGCPHMRSLAMTLARIRHPSLRWGWVSIDTRRCAASSNTASSVALYALTVWSSVPTASSPGEECKCLFAIWA